MINTLKTIQLNVRKQKPVSLSLMNDEQLEDFAVIAMSEPSVRVIQGEVVTMPMGHRNWIKLLPTDLKLEESWVARSMLWIRADIETQSVPIPSSDLTAAIIRLTTKEILVISVYVECNSTSELTRALSHMDQAIKSTREKNPQTEILIMGDFNRHDQLWGGNEVSDARQGEAQPIIEFMNDHSLQSLLKRGTKTFQNSRNQATTIDLILASEELATTRVKCDIHETHHGSDHFAIETTFDTEVPIRSEPDRLLWKNAPWGEIRKQVETYFKDKPEEGSVQELTDLLMTGVTEIVGTLTPKAKPSPYAKRWWTSDLTRLRKAYTTLRNRARSDRRYNFRDRTLERDVKQASKEYHNKIRKQKKEHWENFLGDSTNIWQAAKFVKSPGTSFDKIPPLLCSDGTFTTNKKEQANELLKVFFPPLPEFIEEEGTRPQRAQLPSEDLTLEEVRRHIFLAKPWTAPGDDGMPAEVWKQVWPVVKDRILKLFQKSLTNGTLPKQWRNAKIIPLKKGGKVDYGIAKSWRPISLLPTLGKCLEAIIAQRISYLVEEFGLLPKNHFGARKKRCAEDALILMQENIHKAWRSKKVLSMISFDVKGAFNGVNKTRLLQRLRARGIPEELVLWIDAFCSQRTATISVNGHTSEQEDILQPGIPQGSPISPILYLFFNADLVQRRLDKREGSVAFVDDFTAWVVGESAKENKSNLEDIISHAIDWERRSGATFQGEKTAIIHFTRQEEKQDDSPYTIKGEEIMPARSAKILGIIMDSTLRLKENIANRASKSLKVAMALKRLKTIPPATTRQLFASTVAPVLDYASNMWKHKCGLKETALFYRTQRVGAQAVVGCFKTTAVQIAESEASIRTFQQRHLERAINYIARVETLPKSNPIARLDKSWYRRFTSPLWKLFDAVEMERKSMEEIQPYTLAPWKRRLDVQLDLEENERNRLIGHPLAIRCATSGSSKKGRVGYGVAIQDSLLSSQQPSKKISVTTGTKEEHSPYIAELEAIRHTFDYLSTTTTNREINLFSRNLGALQVIRNPRQQSGQSTVIELYKSADILRNNDNTIKLVWIPPTDGAHILEEAKAQAAKATSARISPEGRLYRAKSTAIGISKRKARIPKRLPPGVGRYTQKLDTGLPGKHTRLLYDNLSKADAAILSRARTGKTALADYMHFIGVVDSELCECGRKEDLEHVLFRCQKWNELRPIAMSDQQSSHWGNLSYYLGGKPPNAQEHWSPIMSVVNLTINFIKATGLFDSNRHNEREAGTPGSWGIQGTGGSVGGSV